MDELRLTETPLLSGADPTEGIVAAELAGHFIRLFIRSDGGVVFRDIPFHPFILLEEPALLDGFHGKVAMRPLSGPGDFRHLALFESWKDCLEAKSFLAKRTGRTPSAPTAPYLFISDPIHQHLLLTGTTFFKGLDFSGLHRLAIDIETACAEGFEFSNPEREEDRILSIAVMDDRGYEEWISAHEMSESRMLERLTAIIRERDPDVIEGHNIFRFDLEYIRARALRHGVRLRWGRDGSEPRVHPSRFTVAERIIDYPRWDVYGRSIIDTYFLLQIYDVSSRELESHGLKQAAIHFGLASPERVYLDRRSMDEAFRNDPQALRRYNLDDARETLALSRLLSHPWFLQTRIFPYSYQTCVIRGNATRINALFLREYLRQGAAVPRPAGAESSFEGGYTDIFETGVHGPIVHCDVASLYPSIMITFGIAPEREHLGLFLPLLAQLRQFRLRAREIARSSRDPKGREYYNALQQTFKVLINSFYGYLGTTIHNFSDPTAAAAVTRKGRELIQTMVARLKELGARPVEVDTDGIYFIPPPGINGEKEEEALVRDLSSILPKGIVLEMDGRYRAMFSYKMKNYALLDYDGRIIVRGSALRSRGMEPYLRQFLAEAIRLLLMGEGEKIPALHADYTRKLKEHRFPIQLLTRTETLREAPSTYIQKVRQGKRPPSAPFEIALQSDRQFRAGDQIAYYVTGHGKDVTVHENCKPVFLYDPNRPDENIDYYIHKLNHLMKRLIPHLPKEPTLFD